MKLILRYSLVRQELVLRFLYAVDVTVGLLLTQLNEKNHFTWVSLYLARKC